MRIKTIFIIVVTVLLTIVLMQNNQEANYTILFSNVRISNLVVMAAMVGIGFVVGLLVGRPRKVRFDDSHPSMDNPVPTKHNTLSEEDREYLE